MNLNCRLENHDLNFLKLGPFLLEEKNSKPFIALFHNLLSPMELHHFKSARKESMKRSLVGRPDLKSYNGKNHGKSNALRTSQQSWLTERNYTFPNNYNYNGHISNISFYKETDNSHTQPPQYPINVQKYLVINDIIAYKVTKRIELASNLILDRPYASEPYQIVNYGIGGQYEVHPDMFGYHTVHTEANTWTGDYRNWYSFAGDRQSTFMIYLSTVDYGGGTVFPLLDINIVPITGAALLWNNLSSDGTPDYMSVHGGCPTFLGSKWVANKWILYYDNFRHSPCDLRPIQPINTFENWK